MNRGKSHTGSAQLTIPQAVIMLVIFLAVQLVTTLVVAFVIGEAELDDSAMTAVASGLSAVIIPGAAASIFGINHVRSSIAVKAEEA